MKLDNVLLKTGDILYWDELHTYKNITDNIDKIRATTRGEQIWRVALVTDTYPDSIRVVTFSRRKLLINLSITSFINKPKRIGRWHKVLYKSVDEETMNKFIYKLRNVDNHDDWIRNLKGFCMGNSVAKERNTTDNFIKLLKDKKCYV